MTATTETTAPTSVLGEVADTLVGVLESAPVQAELTAAVTAGEIGIQTIVDNAINAAKGSGILGIVIAAAKGTVETELNAQIAAYPPATVVAFLTKLAQEEAHHLGG